MKPTRKTNMARIDAKELPALLRAIELYEGRQLTRLAMKLMALTFVRPLKTYGANWQFAPSATSVAGKSGSLPPQSFSSIR